MSTALKIVLPVGIMILCLALVSCGGQVQQEGPKAPTVTVGQPVLKTIRNYQIFTGFSRAIESADVMARVAGILDTVEFEPSTELKKGTLLFTIEKEKYQAARDSAHAGLKSAEADLLRAKAELKRMESASESDAVSEVSVDRARADRDMAIASVDAAKAALDDAELKLSYTQVTSPIDGFVSRNLVDAGNLVGEGGPTLLTRVNKLQPIYVYFNVPESIVLEILEYGSERKKRGEEDKPKKNEAWVALANDEGFPHPGEIDYIDNQVNPETGTIEMRVRLENEDLVLFPGLFVRVKIPGPELPDSVLIPEAAVGTDLGGKYVLLVGENNIVEQRYVDLGQPQDEGLVHIVKGLDGSETVIVNGLMFARPGMPVIPLTPEQFEAMQREAGEQGKTGPQGGA
jgi:RND family efflux transporter MFP subunit